MRALWLYYGELGIIDGHCVKVILVLFLEIAVLLDVILIFFF